MDWLDRRRFLFRTSAVLGQAGLGVTFGVGAFGLGKLRASTAEFRISDALSPRNEDRARRPRTDYIILHTTEADDRSSLFSVQRYGTCHYLVCQSGEVLRIIDADRIANHAGRSLWNGERNLSLRSLGIEIVGTYEKPLLEAQLVALKELLSQLQHRFSVGDRDVLTHSQIACSYHPGEKQLVRGRRKDAVQFGDPLIRRKVGLTEQWDHDPDVVAGRIAFPNNAEGRWLQQALYSAKPGDSLPDDDEAPEVLAKEVLAKEVLAKEVLVKADEPRVVLVRETKPAKAAVAARAAADPAEDDPETVDEFRVLGKDGNTVEELAGKEALSPTTIYFLPDGRIRQGDRLRGSPLLKHPPKGLKVLIGYVLAGEVTARQRAGDIAGAAWNYPSTFYRLPNMTIVPGDEIRRNAIPQGTIVLYRH